MNLGGTQFYSLQSPHHSRSHTGRPHCSLSVGTSAGSPSLGLFPTCLQSCHEITEIQKRSQKYKSPRLHGPVSLKPPLAPFCSKAPPFPVFLSPHPSLSPQVGSHQHAPQKPPSGSSNHPHVATSLFSFGSTTQHHLTQLRGWM